MFSLKGKKMNKNDIDRKRPKTEEGSKGEKKMF